MAPLLAVLVVFSYAVPIISEGRMPRMARRLSHPCEYRALPISHPALSYWGRSDCHRILYLAIRRFRLVAASSELHHPDS